MGKGSKKDKKAPEVVETPEKKRPIWKIAAVAGLVAGTVAGAKAFIQRRK